MLGHIMEKCYILHGCSLGYKSKGKSNANANQVSFDQSIASEGASISSNQCPISKAQCEQLLAFLNSGSGEAHHAANVSSIGVDGFLGMASSVAAGMASTSSQPQANLASQSNLINTMSGTLSTLFSNPNLEHSIFSTKIVNRDFRSIDCVIDTRATNHMVHSITYFTSITSTLNTYVNLPNGEIALVTHIGIVKITEKFVLYNVLCVPSFSFNLISVSELAKTISCCLIFLGNMCFIQDLALWSTIG